jgi:aryl-alcohol dehydrogenase-like predicted oxidoreductase
MTDMEYRRLGESGLLVSRACLGAMTFGTPTWGCDEPEAKKIVQAFLDAGGNFFDTADIYARGASETILGSLLAGVRDEVVIATKVGLPSGAGPNGMGHSRKHIVSACEASLRRLGTDYIDLYQLHHADYHVPVEETLGALDDLVHSGKVRYVGCSNFFAWQVAMGLGVSALRGFVSFSSCQMMYNLVRRDVERDHVEMSAASGVALITYSPLHGGLLAGTATEADSVPRDSRVGTTPDVYLSDELRAFAVVRALQEHATKAGVLPGELALGFVFRQPFVTAVLVGAQRVGELEQNLAAMRLDVDADLWDSLDAATRMPTSYPTDFYERNRRVVELIQRSGAASSSSTRTAHSSQPDS